MKFKILDKYWPTVQNYLDSHPALKYTINQPQQQIITFTISPESSTINIHQEIASKLLIQFNKQKITRPNLILAEWISEYAKILQGLGGNGDGDGDGDSCECGYLNYMMMLVEFQEIKRRIGEKKGVLGKLVKDNRMAMQRHENGSEFEQEKISLGMANVEYRMRLIQDKEESSNQEISRIKNLIKNGLWGVLPQIQGRLQQIQSAQEQINELKIKLTDSK